MNCGELKIQNLGSQRAMNLTGIKPDSMKGKVSFPQRMSSCLASTSQHPDQDLCNILFG